MHPNHIVQVQQQSQIRQHVRRSHSHTFFNALTDPDLLEQVDSLLPAHRERMFPPIQTLSMFMSQALSADRSCQQAVNAASVARVQDGLAPCSTHTGGYCLARQRLPVSLVQSLVQHTGTQLSANAPVSWLWQGRPVRLVDGTTLTMPDTASNREAFPPTSNQKAGVGFPLCRLVSMICLGSGAVLNAAIGPFRGKGGDEQSLLRSILGSLTSGDVLIADAYYSTYLLLCELHTRGVDGVFEQYGARKRSTDFRKGQRLGPRDHLIVIPKPQRCPPWMSEEEFAKVPESLSVRELQVNRKILVTTLLCAKRYPKAQVMTLYKSRWHIELDLRNIKTTLGMEKLSCLSPAMILKEVWVYLLAYNVIRLLMAQAAISAKRHPREISFKHTVQLWIAWGHYAPYDTDLATSGVLQILISQRRVGDRPGRVEPRACKGGRPKYPPLTESRETARARIRQYAH
ncbi:MAG: IS4 family transposase [Gammaproteobacteria bacterium]|nr:IS4 family transposase [Gammaproteobacteria bacterium]